MAQHDPGACQPWSLHTSALSLLQGKQEKLAHQNNLLVSCTLLWGERGGHQSPATPLALEGSPGAQTAAAHTAPCSEGAQTCALHVSPAAPEAEAGGMCCRAQCAQGSKGLPSGLPGTQPGMAGGSGGWRAGGFPASSSGGHEKRRTDTYLGSSQTISFFLLKIRIPQWGCSCDRGLLIFMLTTSWFPIPLAL